MGGVRYDISSHGKGSSDSCPWPHMHRGGTIGTDCTRTRGGQVFVTGVMSNRAKDTNCCC